MTEKKRGRAGIVFGTATGAVGGGLMGAFMLGIPGVLGAAAAALVGVFMGGYLGAVIGGLFATDTVMKEPEPGESETKAA